MGQGAFQGVSRGRGKAGRRRRRGAALALLVAVGVGVGGCSSETETLPSVEVEPRPTASPSPPEPTLTTEPTAEPVTEPVPPPAMEQADEAGAIAAAEYFMELSEYAFLTGDLTTWNEISTTDCGYCRNVEQAVEDAYASGGFYSGGALDLTNGRVDGFAPEIGVYAVVLDYAAGAAVLHDSQGAAVEDVPAGAGAFVVEVVPADDGWRLIEAGTTESAP